MQQPKKQKVDMSTNFWSSPKRQRSQLVQKHAHNVKQPQKKGGHVNQISVTTLATTIAPSPKPLL